MRSFCRYEFLGESRLKDPGYILAFTAHFRISLLAESVVRIAQVKFLGLGGGGGSGGATGAATAPCALLSEAVNKVRQGM